MNGRPLRRTLLLLVVLFVMAVAVTTPGSRPAARGPATAEAAVDAFDLTGTWACCGTGGAPVQTWVITQTGEDLSGQARRPDRSLIGSISGTLRGADVAIAIRDISTGSAVSYGGKATAAAMSGIWSDPFRGTERTWRATTKRPPGPSISGKVTETTCDATSCRTVGLPGR